MAAFPSYLVLTPDNFSEQPQPAVWRTEMEGGMPKQLKRHTRVLVERPVLYLAVSKANYLSFLTFVRTTINNGTDWFDWTDPVDGLTKLARIKGGKYEARPWEGIQTLERWEISMTLETWSA